MRYFLGWLQEALCLHQWKGVTWGWEKNGYDHSGEYYCIHCGKWEYEDALWTEKDLSLAKKKGKELAEYFELKMEA